MLFKTFASRQFPLESALTKFSQSINRDLPVESPSSYLLVGIYWVENEKSWVSVFELRKR